MVDMAVHRKVEGKNRGKPDNGPIRRVKCGRRESSKNSHDMVTWTSQRSHPVLWLVCFAPHCIPIMSKAIYLLRSFTGKVLDFRRSCEVSSTRHSHYACESLD